MGGELQEGGKPSTKHNNKNMMKVKIKRLNDNAIIPVKAHPTDAGFDLTATSRTMDKDGNIVYGTGLAFEIPEGYAGFIFPRSSISKQDLALTNSVGIVDSHYRGEVMCKFKPSWEFDSSFDAVNIGGMDIVSMNDENGCRVYSVGERIAQLVIMPYPEVTFEQSDELTPTDRGTGGYGSTGK